jgi:hypothetical protein
MRDEDPASEVAVWCSITAAWSDYHEEHLDGELLPDEDEKKLLAALIAISTGVTDVDNLGVSPDVGRKLLACYVRDYRQDHRVSGISYRLRRDRCRLSRCSWRSAHEDHE